MGPGLLPTAHKDAPKVLKGLNDMIEGKEYFFKNIITVLTLSPYT